MPPLQQLLDRAIAAHQANRLEEADRLYREAAAAIPDHPLIHFNHGTVLLALGRAGDALACFDKVLALDPGFVPAMLNRAVCLRRLKQPQKAREALEQAARLAPQDVQVLLNLGQALMEDNKVEQALAVYDRALGLGAGKSDALYGKATALHVAKRHDEALAAFSEALTSASAARRSDILINRGLTLLELKRSEEALGDFNQALAASPGRVEALNGAGLALWAMHRFEEALGVFEKGLAIAPGHAGILNNCACLYFDLGRHSVALSYADRALQGDPDYADALASRGRSLLKLHRPAEALESYERAYALDPNNIHALAGLAKTALQLCDWARVAQLKIPVEKAVAEGDAAITPFFLLGLSDDPALHLASAENAVRELRRTVPLPKSAPRRKDKIRIAYLSSDFREHPVAHLVAGLLEYHNRDRFEIMGVSFAPDDKSALRGRLIKAVDRFEDVLWKNDKAVAQLLRANEIDIAIDLSGHTDFARPGIFSYRPAPVQANFLGYPGTVGADFLDYIIADAIVLPFGQQPFYREKIIHMPYAYQVNDDKQVIAAEGPGRADQGLPENSFVFCCFNNSWKIAEPVFSLWMRLLRQIPDSVLWLFAGEPAAAQRLKAEAASRGVDPIRLIFAAPLEHDRHLARLRLADLFLDTLPYNAHTTASDALSAGLPFITCRGRGFPARVGASLLTAAGFAELITNDMHDYESLALKLARDRGFYRGVRDRLEQDRPRMTLFDTKLFRDHLEAAYEAMLAAFLRGEAPKSFSVSPTGEILF